MTQPTAAPTCIAPKPNLTGYKIHRCRCPQCTAANRAYQRRRDRLIAYGQWPEALVNAEPTRQHIHYLLDSGLSYDRISRLAPVAVVTLVGITRGFRGRPPAGKVRRDTAAAIAAVQPDRSLIADGRPVDATATRRRMQGLAAIGWPFAEQARRLGKTPSDLRRALTSPTVSARREREVKALFEQLQGTPAPNGWVARRIRAHAAAAGWAPPAAWDDDIDDPAARPHGVPRTRTASLDPRIGVA